MFTKTFSWGWLKSKKEEKQIDIYEELRKDKERIEEKILVVRNTIYSNGIGTVIFKDGDVFSKEIDFDKMQLVKDCTSKEELYDLFAPLPEKALDEDDFEKEAQLNFLEYKQEVLDLLGEEFNEKNGLFYYKTISLSIDSLILNSLIEAKKESKEDVFESLIMFWLKCCLIPVKEAREDIYANVKKYDVKLTPTGNFIGFRRICKVNDNTQLLEFISQQYFKIKTWRKSPKDYSVFHSLQELDYQLIRIDKIAKPEFQKENYIIDGNLFDLYNELSNLKENHYTDNYTKTYTIKIGETYKIKEKDLDFNYYKSCGGAIHLSLGYDAYDYSPFGDTDVICIINPQHMFKSDTGHSGKIGVTQMFIAGVREKDKNDKFIDIPETDLVHFDELYHNETIQELENAIDNKSFEILEVTDTNNVTEISPITILDLTTIKNNISKRIINF